MAVSAEEIAEARRQLQEQINRIAPERQADAQAQLDSMTDETIASMLEQQRGEVQSKGPQKGIFRMLVDGEIPSKKVDENKEAIAIVSKRALSKGHVLIIPKKVTADAKNLPAQVFGMAKALAKKMVSKMKANSTEIQTETAFGEVIANVIPVYDKPINVNSPRYEASDEEMQEVYEKLRVIVRPKKEKIKIKKRESEVLKLRRRVP